MPNHPQPVILKDADGNLDITVHHVNKVGIKSIGCVISHHVNTAFGSRSHVVNFVNGGVLRFAYNANDVLIELSARKLDVEVTPDGDAMFDMAE